jgi:WD40 repeat protein
MSGLTDFGRTSPRLTRRWKMSIDDHVVAVCWSPKGAHLAVAGAGGPITVLSVAGKITTSMIGHDLGTLSLSWQPDGLSLASGGQDGKIRFWNSDSGRPGAVVAGGAAWVEQVSWSPMGTYLASAAGKKLRFLRPEGELLREFGDHPATITDLAWRPGSGELTTATYGGVALWKPDVPEPTAKLTWKGSVLKLAWSPTGMQLAHGNQDATVHFWDLKTGHDLEMAGYPMKVRELAWDPTGTYLATGGGPAVTVWNCAGRGPENTKPISLAGHDEPISALAYQARGPLLASGDLAGRVLLFQPGKFKKSFARSDLGSAVTQAAWSPDDRLLAVATEQGDVVVYSVG